MLTVGASLLLLIFCFYFAPENLRIDSVDFTIYTFAHMTSKSLQLQLLKKQSLAYGGELLKTRKGRSSGRPLSTRHTMHLVLRSSKAKGEWSFSRPKNKDKVTKIISRFSHKFGVRIISIAHVGNHLHFHIKLSRRHTFKPFIRAVTASIAMGISGVSRWNPTGSKRERLTEGLARKLARDRFWDYRPFTRVVTGYRAFLNLKDYIQLNQLEGFGFQRNQARFFLAWNKSNLLSINSS